MVRLNLVGVIFNLLAAAVFGAAVPAGTARFRVVVTFLATAVCFAIGAVTNIMVGQIQAEAAEAEAAELERRRRIRELRG